MSLFKIVGLGFVVATLVAIVAYILHRRSMLTPHLKPYFKNSAELNASVDKYREAQEKRRKELTEPTNIQEAAEYLSLNDFHVAHPTYQLALEMVERGLKDDPSDYGMLLGEVYCFSRAYMDPEKAYYYYLIGFSQAGYSVAFKNENLDSNLYYGPIGDFRHESQVSALVDELGFDKIKQLDIKALEWLADNNIDVVEDVEKRDPRTD